MWTRRRFLGSTGTGLLAMAAASQLPNTTGSAWGETKLPIDLQRRKQLKQRKQHLLGYPINMNTPPKEFFRWRAELLEAGIDEFAYNNVGNPFKKSPLPFNTHDFEREVIVSFGGQFEFPRDDTWGFLSHSGTDSNMHGMYMGRTILKGRAGRQPTAYFTREAHYSVQILADLLGLDVAEVATLPDGAMDPADLAAKLDLNRDRPALVVATVGTTFKGAIDDVDKLQRVLADRESYLHVDAALFGGYLPFTSHRQEVTFRSDPQAHAGRYDSIAVSCHKFFGFPSPAGLFVTRRSLYEEFNKLFSQIHNPEYIHQVPGTITCSRDAVKPAEFYYFTTPAAVARQQDDAAMMLKHAGFLHDQLQTHFPALTAQRANPLSNTIYFRNPGRRIVQKYSLATMQLDVGEKEPVTHAHVVVMPHVSHEVMVELLDDIEASSRRG